MKLIVGLGNPGRQYELTRHNIGFEVIDSFALLNNSKIDKNKFNGLYSKININNEDIILLKPQSYMNLSGEVVRKYIDYFKIDIDNVLIISDDLDMDFGHIRLRSQGSSGGHNGLKNIELHLGTKEYKRLKIGISNNKMIDTKDYVLGKISKEEEKQLSEVKEKTSLILRDFITMDFDNLMNKYN